MNIDCTYIPFPPIQCDQIGRFLKVLGNNFACKNIGDFLGSFEKYHLMEKLLWHLFGQLLETFLLQYLVTLQSYS